MKLQARLAEAEDTIEARNVIHTGWCICIWTIFESGCGIQMSQATPTKFSMLFKHNYGKLS